MTIKILRRKTAVAEHSALIEQALLRKNVIRLTKEWIMIDVPNLDEYLACCWQLLAEWSKHTPPAAFYDKWTFHIEGKSDLFWWKLFREPKTHIKYGRIKIAQFLKLD